MPTMRRGITYQLAIVAFVALAVAFDGFAVAAVVEEFGGLLRVLLALVCLVVGTLSAYLLTRQGFRVLLRRHIRARRRAIPATSILDARYFSPHPELN